MDNNIVFGIMLLCLALPQPASAKTVGVCQGSCQFRSIQAAIDYAAPGDTILVNGGTYYGNISIAKPLRLIGINKPVIDAKYSGDVIKSTSADITINGFVIKDSGRSDIEDFAGIKFLGDDYSIQDCHIDNNIILNNLFGIWVGNARRCTITNNLIRGPSSGSEVLSGNGIHLWHCTNFMVDGNTISDQRDGMYFEFTSNSNVNNNISKDNLRYGIHFMYSSNNSFTGNTFVNNQTGAAVMVSNHIHMEFNKFLNSWGPVSYGLFLKEMDDCYLDRNIFEHNTVAIVVENAERNKIAKNDFINNGTAIRLAQSDSTDNLFEYNNFISNTFDVGVNDFMDSHNIFQHNYWSDYTGYDLDRNGIGDVPFKPVKLMSLYAQKFPASLILLKSLFIDILDFTENMIPSLTPSVITDNYPSMKVIKWSK
jgi:nitrous oxidase accessory protein